MKNAIGIMILCAVVDAQAQPAEIMTGNKYLLYQHAISKQIAPDSKWGVMHIVSSIVRYRSKTESTALPDELMNQAYIKYRVHKKFSVIGGMFYSTAVKFKPSIGVQYTYPGKDLFITLQPRVDITKNVNYELFGLVEYRRKLNNSIAMYSRLQFMTNHGREFHNRSYQQFRLGVEYRLVQTGIGLQLDEYGPNATRYTNIGIFVKKNLY